METSTAKRPGRESDTGRQFSAYGPIEAVLGYILFYTIIERLTPTIVTVFSQIVLDLSAALVHFGLAAILWFVFVVTAVDQIRRQFAALGVGSSDESERRVWSRITPSSLRTTGYLVALVFGSGVALMTFERAVAALQSLMPVVATVDVLAIDFVETFVMVVFFFAYSVAAHAFDRLVIGGIRILVAD